MNCRIQFLAVAVTACCAQALGAAFSLDGTIRDFKKSGSAGGHPDFEAFLGDDRQIVQVSLGADKTPVYAGNPSTPTTTGATEFYSWFHNVPGVNLSTTYSITLDETAPGSGIFGFSNSAFFPIDGQLFGNEEDSHNYAFTYELHTRFTYKPGQSFSFSGDDDVWVYINEKLVIDLGGVHSEESASVDLDTLGLSAGTSYNLDLFFAERHTTGSNFSMETSLELTNVPEPTAFATAAGLLVVAGAFGIRRWKR